MLSSARPGVGRLSIRPNSPVPVARPARPLRQRAAPARPCCCSGAASLPQSQAAPSLAARCAAAASAFWQHQLARLGCHLHDIMHLSKAPVNTDALNANIKSNVKSMRRLAVIAPFASASASAAKGNLFVVLSNAVSSFIQIYLLLLFGRVLLGWFPQVNWERQPLLALQQVTDPYLNLWRNLVPPLLGTIDLTPLFGFLILQFLEGALAVKDDDNPYL